MAALGLAAGDGLDPFEPDGLGGVEPDAAARAAYAGREVQLALALAADQLTAPVALAWISDIVLAQLAERATVLTVLQPRFELQHRRIGLQSSPAACRA